MKLTLHHVILAVAAQGLDITVEDAVSVEDASSVHLVESTTTGALAVEVNESRSARWREKGTTATDRVLKWGQTKKSTRTPTKTPSTTLTMKPTTKPTKEPTKTPSSAPAASPAPSDAHSVLLAPLASPAPSDAHLRDGWKTPSYLWLLVISHVTNPISTSGSILMVHQRHSRFRLSL